MYVASIHPCIAPLPVGRVVLTLAICLVGICKEHYLLGRSDGSSDMLADVQMGFELFLEVHICVNLTQSWSVVCIDLLVGLIESLTVVQGL